VRKALERNNQLLKKLDFWLGIPLLYCLSKFKRKAKSKPEKINTIGLFAFAAIGDSILSSCLLPALKDRYPQAKIIIFASSANAAIYPALSGYDELVVLPVTSPLKALKLLRGYSLDLLIDTSQWSKLGALYSLLIKARFKIGFKTSSQYRHFGYDAEVEHSDAIHEIDNFRNLLKPLQIPCQDGPSLDLIKIRSQNLDSHNLEKYQPYIVLHPWASGTRSELRQWPIDSWVELAKSILSDNFNLMISGSPQNHADAVHLVSMIGEENRVGVIAGKLSLLETANVIMGAKAVVSVNTGIAHLADHLNVPAIALNGPTNSKRWGLVNPDSRNIDVPKHSGGGILNLGFEYPSNAQYTMDQITVQEVEAVMKQLV
jgi:ADP-heptose:LPS heptosyltransferase